MKKILTILVFSLCVLSLSTAGFASMLKKNVSFFRGTVLSIDGKTSQLKLKERKSGNEVTINYKGGLDPMIKAGSKVVVVQDNGTKIAKSIRIVGK